MARTSILSNGELCIGLDEHGLVHDFYYPYVGLDNLTTARSMHHKIGLWIDGEFSWIDSEDWEIEINVHTDMLVSTLTARSERFGIEYYGHAFVDVHQDVFCRQIEIRNFHDERREIRLFMHQVFEVSRAGRADTAIFVPGERYILDYKGNCCLLISGQTDKKRSFDQFAVGNYGIEGKVGTFMDAEDGELSGNLVEHGGVDSVIRFSLEIEPLDSRKVDYWIVAGDSQQEVETIHNQLKVDGLELIFNENAKQWNSWLAIAEPKLRSVAPEYQEQARHSLLTIKAHCDVRGGIIASADSSIYNYNRDYYSYVWPRDGAYALLPLILLGYRDEPKAFFKFCKDTLHPDGYLMHKYQVDRSIGSTWHPLMHNHRKELAIQEDETASVVYAYCLYVRSSHDNIFLQKTYNTLLRPMATFLSRFIDLESGLPHASYDLWEQRFGTHSYSVAMTITALEQASQLATQFRQTDDATIWQEAAQNIREQLHQMVGEDGSYVRSVLLTPQGERSTDTVVDISTLYGFGHYLSDTSDAFKKTFTQVEEQLIRAPGGGVARYVHDDYFQEKSQYPGNPWIVCSLWLAQLYLERGDVTKAEELIRWSLSCSLKSGVLPEQVDPEDRAPIGVAPLVWSHAEFLRTVLLHAAVTDETHTPTQV